jgi:hypothetical protein|tara:strand:- start:339 stop:512 length:174 start_codon:yes stop_codon:yes gene_type:complete
VGDAVESFTVVDNIARIQVVVNLTGLSWKHRDLIGVIAIGVFLLPTYWHNTIIRLWS